jgi:hypothetical protein
MLRLETGLVVLAVLIAWVYPSLGSKWFEEIERRLSALARRRALSVLLIGGLALTLRLAVLPVEPIPEPIVHDEFGYLLAADTYAHGRLTNPTPPFWEHFETFSILMKPTYQCFAQPGQGMMLALGQVVFGNPFWGVWLSCGLMCAAITWMLQGWVSLEWALLGGFISVLRYGVFGYWANSYWGGAVGAIGGALVLGALPRIKESQRIRDALLMGLGLAILANTRPFEGFVFSIPIAVILIAWLIGKKSPSFRITVPRVVLPLTLVVTVAAAGLGYYLWRVTGSPLRMPYQIERQTYAVAPYFVWQDIRPEPAYDHAEMRTMFVHEEMLGLKTYRSFIGVPLRLYLAWGFFLGPVLTLPLFMLALSSPHNLRFGTINRSTLALLFILTIFIAGTLLVNFYSPHYSAPATSLTMVLLLVALRQLKDWGNRGRFLARAVPIICVLSFTLRTAANPLHIPLSEFYEFNWYQKNYPSFGREEIERQLLHSPGKHLVFVHYNADHEPFAEWVYNKADLNTATIVWAREIARTSDKQLIDAFPGRHTWTLDADANPPQLHPYTTSPSIQQEDSLPSDAQ